MRVREARFLFGERQQRIAFGAAHAPTRVFAKKKHHKGENENQANREGEWDNGHG